MDKETKQILKDVIKNELQPFLIGIRNDITELTKTHKDGMSTPLAIQFTPEAIKEFKHHDGKTPVKGEDYFTQKEADEFLKSATPVRGKHYFTAVDIADFKTAVTPIKGVDYTDGYTPVKGTDYFTDEEVASFLTKITPVKGIHYRDGTDGVTTIKEVSAKVTAEEIRNKLEGLKGSARLSVKAIKGWQEAVSDYITEKGFGMKSTSSDGGIGGSGGNGGGSTSITAGTNVTISGTGTATDPYIINASGGGGAQTPWASDINAAGFTLYGNSTSGGNLTLASTSNATKGKILFGTSCYDEVNNRMGINTTSPVALFHIVSDLNSEEIFRVSQSTDANAFWSISDGGGGGTFIPLFRFKGSSTNANFVIGDSTTGTDTGTNALIRMSGRINNSTVVTRPIFDICNVNAPLVSVGAAGTVSFTPTALSGAQAFNTIDIAHTWDTTGTPSAIKVNVTDTKSNALSKLLDLQINGANAFSVLKTNIISIGSAGAGFVGFAPINSASGSVLQSGEALRFYARTTNTQNAFSYWFSSPSTYNPIAGNGGLITTPHTFSPASGTAVWNVIRLNPTISQTGTASGTINGITISPTITNLLGDFNAIKVDFGTVLLAAGVTARASLRMPAGVAPTTPVDGDIWFDGTDIKMQVAGTTKTFVLV